MNCQQIKVSLEQLRGLFRDLNDSYRKLLEARSLDRIDKESLYQSIEIIQTQAKDLIVKIEINVYAYITTAIEQAKEILGAKNVLGAERVEEVWGVKLDPSEIPPIPFSRDELQQMQESGGIKLVLRIGSNDQDQPLIPITILHTLLPYANSQPILRKSIVDLINQIDNTGDFALETPIKDSNKKAQWALTVSFSNENIRNIIVDNYFEITQLNYKLLQYQLAYIKHPHRRRIIQQALRQFEQFYQEHENLFEQNQVLRLNPRIVKNCNNVLANLEVNQLTMYTVAQFLYDSLMLMKEGESMRTVFTCNLTKNDQIISIGIDDRRGVVLEPINIDDRIELTSDIISETF